MNESLPTAAAPNRIAALNAASSVRWERVREARRKIARGDYQRPEVLAEVVARLVDEVGRS